MGKVIMFPIKVVEPKGKVVKPSDMVGRNESYININIKESLSKYIRLGLDRFIGDLETVPECLLMLSELLNDAVDQVDEMRESQ